MEHSAHWLQIIRTIEKKSVGKLSTSARDASSRRIVAARIADGLERIADALFEANHADLDEAGEKRGKRSRCSNGLKSDDDKPPCDVRRCAGQVSRLSDPINKHRNPSKKAGDGMLLEQR
jgi:gamma-glutamyl phosphate reductase